MVTAPEKLILVAHLYIKAKFLDAERDWGKSSCSWSAFIAVILTRDANKNLSRCKLKGLLEVLLVSGSVFGVSDGGGVSIIIYYNYLLLVLAVGPSLIWLMQTQCQTSQEMNALNSNVSIHDAGQLMPLFFLWNSLESVERQSKLEPESVPITEPELGFPQHTNP